MSKESNANIKPADLRNNDSDAWELFYNTQGTKLLRIAAHSFTFEEAEDIVMRTMENVIKGLDHFDGLGNFNGWVGKIFTNVCNDAGNKLTHINEMVEETVFMSDDESLDKFDLIPETSGVSPEEQIILKEEAEYAFQQLPVGLHPIVLMIAQGYSYTEISQQYDIPRGTIKSRMSRARNIVVDIFDKENIEISA